jgi:hypothetical protein
MEHLVSNGYIQYALLIGAILRISRIGLDDGIFDRPRRWIRGITIVKEQIAETDRYIDIEQELPVGPIREKLRAMFSCPWCLPFWISAVLTALTLLFPEPMTYFNLFFATPFLVSVLYGRYA